MRDATICAGHVSGQPLFNRVSKRSREPSRGGRKLPWGWVVGLLLGGAIAWLSMGVKRTAPAPASALAASDRAALSEFVDRYFATWSAKDIDGYGRCFHPTARISFGTGASLALPEFLESQRRAHAQSPVPLTEHALSWDGNIHNGLAHVRVHWELHRGSEKVRGWNFFTLALSEGRWQIVALIFNEE